jgi:glycosyltransferase involved in cell wall biosynthesis
VKISVITATFNCAGTVREALGSVAAQRYDSVEHLVIDGASTDGTWDAIQAHGLDRLVAISEPDLGIYDALNKGIARSSGDVIGFLHADDLFASPDVLSWVAEAFADPAIDAVYGDLQYVRSDDTQRVVRHWRSEPFAPELLARGWMPPHPTLYLRRAMYERLGGYDAAFRIAADYEFILRLFSRPGLHAVYIPRVMVKMRMGGLSNRSLRHMLRKSTEDWRALRRHHIGGIFTMVRKNLSKVGQFFDTEPRCTIQR